MSQRIPLRWEGRPLEIEVEVRRPHAALIRDGHRFEADVRRDGSWIVVQGSDRSVRCAVVAGPRGVWVAHEGRTYVLERAHREASTHGGATATDEIRAPMTGRVVAVVVRPGVAAREGDLLLTVEAMKMEFRLTAPEDGTVSEVLCAAGDRVELGQLLARIVPAPSGTASAAGRPAAGNPA